MSDVEMLTHNNQERRRWAEEYEEQLERISPNVVYHPAVRHCGLPAPKSRRRMGVLRTACTACCMACGGGAAFMGLGLAMGHWLTVAVGAVWSAAFFITGIRLEDALEQERGSRG